MTALAPLFQDLSHLLGMIGALIDNFFAWVGRTLADTTAFVNSPTLPLIVGLVIVCLVALVAGRFGGIAWGVLCLLLGLAAVWLLLGGGDFTLT
jgi:hypothetical protein